MCKAINDRKRYALSPEWARQCREHIDRPALGWKRAGAATELLLDRETVTMCLTELHGIVRRMTET